MHCTVLLGTEADPRTFSGIPIVIVISTVIGCINVNTLIRRGRVLMIPWSGARDILSLQVRGLGFITVLGRRQDGERRT